MTLADILAHLDVVQVALDANRYDDTSAEQCRLLTEARDLVQRTRALVLDVEALYDAETWRNVSKTYPGELVGTLDETGPE
jgi:hypothetical protein